MNTLLKAGSLSLLCLAAGAGILRAQVRIGAPANPAGTASTTAATGSGTAPNKKTVLPAVLPVQNYVVIDLGGSPSKQPVQAIALDEKGNGAFAAMTDHGDEDDLHLNETVFTSTFASGRVTGTTQFETISTPNGGQNWWFINPRYLRPSGEWLGNADIVGFVPPYPPDPNVTILPASPTPGGARGTTVTRELTSM